MGDEKGISWKKCGAMKWKQLGCIVVCGVDSLFSGTKLQLDICSASTEISPQNSPEPGESCWEAVEDTVICCDPRAARRSCALQQKQQIPRLGVPAKDGVWGVICLLEISVLLEGREIHCSFQPVLDLLRWLGLMYKDCNAQTCQGGKKQLRCLPCTPGRFREVMAGRVSMQARVSLPSVQVTWH